MVRSGHDLTLSASRDAKGREQIARVADNGSESWLQLYGPFMAGRQPTKPQPRFMAGRSGVPLPSPGLLEACCGREGCCWPKGAGAGGGREVGAALPGATLLHRRATGRKGLTRGARARPVRGSHSQRTSRGRRRALIGCSAAGGAEPAAGRPRGGCGARRQ